MAGDENKTKFPSKFELRWENRWWNGPQVKIVPSTITNQHMMTSPNRNIFRVTGPLIGEFTGHRRIIRYKGKWRGALTFSLIFSWTNGWVSNRDACYFKRHRAHYAVIAISNDVEGAFAYFLSPSTRAISYEMNCIYRSVFFLNFNSFCFSHDFMSLPPW